MSRLLLNTIAVDPTRWSPGRTPYFKLVDLLPALAAHAFTDLELWESHLHYLDDAEFTALRAAIDDGGFAAPIVGMYPSLSESGDAAEAERDRQTRLLDRAAAIGASVVKCFAGNDAPSGLTPADRVRNIDRFRDLIERAADRDLIVTVESHAGTLCDSADACLSFFEDLGSDRLFLCYQPFDFTDSDAVLADYERLAPFVRHLHLQGRRGGDFSALEESDIDYGRLFAAMQRHDFDDFVCIEFVADGAPEQPADFDLDHVLRNAERDRAYVLAGPLFG